VNNDEIMRRIGAIGPALAERARDCDAARRVVPESMRLMIDAGLFRIPQPLRTGGYELSLRTLDDAITAVSEYCPSSGWVLMVMGAHHWCIGSFSETAQDEVFGNGGDGLVAGTLSWQGTAKAVSGGYVINGRWQFCSGVDHSQWVMVGCRDTVAPGPLVHVLVRREEIKVDDTWHVMGLQGTGSKDIVARDLFVPDHRAIDTRILFGGDSPYASNHITNLYRLSAEAILCASAASALLGSAKFGLNHFVERTLERTVILTGARKAEHGPTQLRLAEAIAEIHCADLMLHDILSEFDSLVSSGAKFTLEHRARVKWFAAYVAELCRRSVGRLYGGSGAHAVYSPSALQVAFRNINAGAQHASIDFDTSGELYARTRLNLR